MLFWLSLFVGVLVLVLVVVVVVVGVVGVVVVVVVVVCCLLLFVSLGAHGRRMHCLQNLQVRFGISSFRVL